MFSNFIENHPDFLLHFFVGSCLIFYYLLVFKHSLAFFIRKKKGLVLTNPKFLPDLLFVVVFTDKTTTVLEAKTPKKQRFLISTEIITGSVRPQDVVRKANNRARAEYVSNKSDVYVFSTPKKLMVENQE